MECACLNIRQALNICKLLIKVSVDKGLTHSSRDDTKYE